VKKLLNAYNKVQKQQERYNRSEVRKQT